MGQDWGQSFERSLGDRIQYELRAPNVPASIWTNNVTRLSSREPAVLDNWLPIYEDAVDALGWEQRILKAGPVYYGRRIEYDQVGRLADGDLSTVA